MGRLFSRSFDVFKRNLKIAAPFFLEQVIDLIAMVIFALVALLALGISFLSLADMNPQAALYYLLTGGMPGLQFVGIIIFAALVLVVFLIIMKAAARAATIGMAYHGIGGSAAYDDGLQAVWGHGMAVLGFFLTLGVLLLLVIFIPFLPTMLLASLGAGEFIETAAVLMGLLFAFLLAIGVYVLTLFAPQHIVLKKAGVMEGIKGSSDFVYSHAADTAVYIVFAIAISIPVLLILPNIFTPITMFSGSTFLNTFLGILQNLLSIIGALLLNAYLETVKTAMVMEA